LNLLLFDEHWKIRNGWILIDSICLIVSHGCGGGRNDRGIGGWGLDSGCGGSEGDGGTSSGVGNSDSGDRDSCCGIKLEYPFF